jgi:hypothetical protein
MSGLNLLWVEASELAVIPIVISNKGRLAFIGIDFMIKRSLGR